MLADKRLPSISWAVTVAAGTRVFIVAVISGPALGLDVPEIASRRGFFPPFVKLEIDVELNRSRRCGKERKKKGGVGRCLRQLSRRTVRKKTTRRRKNRQLGRRSAILSRRAPRDEVCSPLSMHQRRVEANIRSAVLTRRPLPSYFVRRLFSA